MVQLAASGLNHMCRSLPSHQDTQKPAPHLVHQLPLLPHLQMVLRAGAAAFVALCVCE